MKKLYLKGNEIDDITAIESLVNLTYLQISNNEVDDISVIGNFKNVGA
ncbi:leucine-rich repeat domain-containing protein [Herbivorax sp. ANBcel31]|nr:leucine-rich repeat domain-containing protein [Herbivorax sp. ANBcel31]MDQ2087083.1 leucine-rich repeat domain-containing protein [Herbivorax sp. ANBcel31]